MLFLLFFFFNDTAPTQIYTLSLHDALPISQVQSLLRPRHLQLVVPNQTDRIERRQKTHPGFSQRKRKPRDRKSTRLNSSHVEISYAVFCLKKKKKKKTTNLIPKKTT